MTPSTSRHPNSCVRVLRLRQNSRLSISRATQARVHLKRAHVCTPYAYIYSYQHVRTHAHTRTHACAHVEDMFRKPCVYAIPQHDLTWKLSPKLYICGQGIFVGNRLGSLNLVRGCFWRPWGNANNLELIGFHKLNDTVLSSARDTADTLT